MSLFKKKIIQIISRLSEKDFDGALPYLMLTSKSESIVRDLLAFRLHKQFRGKNYAVAREWIRTDIAVLAPVLVGKTEQFKAPKAIIEIKMVAAPGKDDKNIDKHLKALTSQLKKREKIWRNAECFGLLVVRDFRETSRNSTSAFNERFIKSKGVSLRSNPNFHLSVKSLMKKSNLRQVKRKRLVCGEDKILKARVSLKLWLFSLR
jgi:hypothetical protein